MDADTDGPIGALLPPLATVGPTATFGAPAMRDMDAVRLRCPGAMVSVGVGGPITEALFQLELSSVVELAAAVMDVVKAR